MFLACLVSVLGLPSHEYEYNPELWCICDCSLDKQSSCSSAGLGAFSTLQGETARPSVIYPLSKATVIFTEQFCTDQLQLESGSYVSGKLTGLFTPKESGNYTFRSRVSHYRTSSFFFSVGASALVDIDVDDGVYKSDLTCSVYWGNGCSRDESGSGINTNCVKCDRVVELEAGSTYPVYGGLLTGAHATQSSNLKVELLYMSPSSSDFTHVTSDDAVVGYSEGCATSLSSSKSASTAVVGGAMGAVVAIVAVVAIILWVIFMKKTSRTKKRDDKRDVRKDYASGSGKGRTSRGGSSKKGSSKDGSSRAHGSSSRKK